MLFIKSIKLAFINTTSCLSTVYTQNPYFFIRHFITIIYYMNTEKRFSSGTLPTVFCNCCLCFRCNCTELRWLEPLRVLRIRLSWDFDYKICNKRSLKTQIFNLHIKLKTSLVIVVGQKTCKYFSNFNFTFIYHEKVTVHKNHIWNQNCFPCMQIHTQNTHNGQCCVNLGQALKSQMENKNWIIFVLQLLITCESSKYSLNLLKLSYQLSTTQSASS